MEDLDEEQELDFLDVKCAHEDHYISQKPAQVETSFEPIYLEELLFAHLEDPFCSEIRLRLNRVDVGIQS